ncbi:outer membrane lipoprotein chaperone LolA [Variovorax sp. HJSM1_2]|uniref:outer membrane lipoprotein chaperone LolA n=1 Tax=Variovorax sp. HJSM1_2 TaxID=3366263 RepID=UPI003BE66913
MQYPVFPRRVFFAILIAGTVQLASADGLKSLEDFMKGTQSGRADFSQVVTSPPKDGQVARSKTSSGQFEFQRPNKFRFVYKKPFEQTIVADGKTLWLYDADLNQVTQRAQDKVLGSTPAALLASTPDLQALRADFNLVAAPDADGLQWVQATPKAKDTQVQNVRVGFEGSRLAVLDILDGFGQRSVITFRQFESNPKLAAEVFQFKAPAGADVLKP